jgi:hypothetical protein
MLMVDLIETKNTLSKERQGILYKLLFVFTNQIQFQPLAYLQ